MITEFEPRVPRIGQDDLGAPDMVFMVTDGLIIFDRVKHRLITLVHAHVEEDPEEPTIVLSRSWIHCSWRYKPGSKCFCFGA